MKREDRRKVFELFCARLFDEALRCVDNVLARNSSDGTAWLNKGNCLFQLRRMDEAMQCFQNAVFHDPLEAEAWFSKGFTEIAAGREAAANRSFLGFLAVATEDSIDLIEEAKMYLREIQEKGFQPMPHSPPSLLADGHAHQKSGRKEQALACYDTALALNPAYTLALKLKAKCLSEFGAFEHAVQTWERYLKRAPKCAEGKTELSRARSKLEALG